jgi:hypothetical protein
MVVSKPCSRYHWSRSTDPIWQAPTTCQKPVSTQAEITHDSVKLTRYVSEDMYAARWVWAVKIGSKRIVAFGYIAHALKT